MGQSVQKGPLPIICSHKLWVQLLPTAAAKPLQDPPIQGGGLTPSRHSALATSSGWGHRLPPVVAFAGKQVLHGVSASSCCCCCWCCCCCQTRKQSVPVDPNILPSCLGYRILACGPQLRPPQVPGISSRLAARADILKEYDVS